MEMAVVESRDVCDSISSLGRYFCGIYFAQDFGRRLGANCHWYCGIYDFDDLKRGREIVYHRLETDALPMSLFIQSIGSSNETHFVPGEAIFLTGNPNIVPHAMLHNIKHNKVLHERNVMVTVYTRDIPYVAQQDRIKFEKLNDHFYRIFMYYGFKDQPNIPQALEQAYDEWGFDFDMMQISFFISRDRLIHTVGDGMSPWREKLFISMQRNTSPVSDFYQIPPNRVVELGSQIEI